MVELAIGIGAQKAGTSSVWIALRAQRWFLPAVTKELHYFTLLADRGPDWYASQFPVGDDGVRGEITPSYLTSREAAHRIAAQVPEARLFAILRNPVDRAYSAFLHGVRLGDFPRGMDFAAALDAEPRRWGTPFSDLIRGGLYYRHLLPYFRLFPSEQLHIAFLEDLIRPDRTATHDLLAFVGGGRGIEHRALPRVNVYRAAGPRSSARAVTYVQRWALLRDRRRLAAALAQRGQGGRRPTDPPPMDPAVRGRLLARFADENAALAGLLGRELPGWDQ